MEQQIPERGDIVYLNFSPQSGHEQEGLRPAIVLSPKVFNAGKFIVACPITSKTKGYPFEVKLPARNKIQGVILTDQVRSMDWRSRNLKYVCQASSQTVQECLEKVSLILSLEQ